MDWDAVAEAVGPEKLREYGGTWKGGPAMAPWLGDGGLAALVPGGSKWMNVFVCFEKGAPEVWCGCRQAGPYCSHSLVLMAYAAANMDYLKAVRAAEDDGIREAAKTAEPGDKKEIAKAASGKDPADRMDLHLLKLPPRGLPPRGIDYGRMLDMAYVNLSSDCFLEEFADVDFGVAERVAGRFAASGDLAEAARIYGAVAETVAKNVAITDDSNAHYSYSLKTALEKLAGCMVSRAGRPRKKLPDSERRKHISWLARRVARNDPDFFTEDFASALDSVCAAPGDVEWRKEQESMLRAKTQAATGRGII